MPEINLLRLYPRSKRPVEGRGKLITPEVQAEARKYGHSFFDGERLYGYGGYGYHPRFWSDTVRLFREYYQLPLNAAILDVGCAKGFMMHDFKKLMPEAAVRGLDISQYAVDHAIEDMRPFIEVGNAKELPYPDNSFDLVISIATVHNLPPIECRQALREIQRVSRGAAFITVDAWRNDYEREQLKKWVLTAYTYMHVEDWKAFFEEAGYTGDYWWFIAETE